METRSKVSGRLTPDQQKEKALDWVKSNAEASNAAREQLNSILRAGPIHSSLLSDLKDKYGIPKPVSAWVKLWDEFVCYSGKKDSPVGQPAVAIADRKDDEAYWSSFRRTLVVDEDDAVSPWMRLGIPSAGSVCGQVRYEIFRAFLLHLEKDDEKWLLMSEVCFEFIRFSGMRFQDFFQNRKPSEIAKSQDGLKFFEWHFSDQCPPILSVRRKARTVEAPLQELHGGDLTLIKMLVKEKTPEAIDFAQMAMKLHVGKDSVYVGYLKALKEALSEPQWREGILVDALGTSVAAKKIEENAKVIEENRVQIVKSPAPETLVAKKLFDLAKRQGIMSSMRGQLSRYSRQIEGERRKIEEIYSEMSSLKNQIEDEPLVSKVYDFIIPYSHSYERDKLHRLDRELSDRVSAVREIEQDRDLIDDKYKNARYDLGFDKLLSDLYGKTVRGKVVDILPAGATVDIEGVCAWLPLSEMSWDYVENADEVVSVGEERDFTIIPDREDAGRVIVSIRRGTDDPWNTVTRKYPVGEAFAGIVTRYAANDDGVVVSLAPGVNGFLPLAEIPASIRKDTASSSIEKGSRVIVVVKSIVRDQRKILLSMKQAIKPAVPIDAHPADYYVRVLFGHDNPTIEDIWRLFYTGTSRDALTGSNPDEWLHAYSDYLFSIVRCDDGRRFVVYVASEDPEAYALASIDIKRAKFSGWKDSHHEEGRWLKIAEVEDKEMIDLFSRREPVLRQQAIDNQNQNVISYRR